MPSIPQSLLWISLVILWLFVLVPMLISKRDAVRRTSDVALATRVLNSGAAARLLKRRGGPAAGHRSDPDWQPEEDQFDDLDDDTDTERIQQTEVVVAAAVVTEAAPDSVDTEVIEADPVPESATDTAVSEEDSAPAEPEEEPDDSADDEFEYVEDTSGIAVAEEQDVRPVAARRHGHDTRTAAAVSARKYAFRRRMLLTMAMILAASAAAAFLLTPTAWWVCGTTGGVTVLYLGYLRRQTRIEARLRRRRMQRMARSRLGVENTHDREFDVVPSRLRRPGAVVLEIDDEDPIFEHLDYAPYERDYGWHRDLPRAVGQ
ncbi:hypothetical protein MFM001_11430 [Mycobacterium sp. MFM001]|uniref:divisome protein SepX/GlpR n=1 Tax=Mycobacterium sp. MFM001 TaxID=2049453 RepID=UPI000DA5CA4D|nr:gephyrin-like molybdotransferase receptor GlpR [Mycobacterium sp. MFM001]GBE64681.1 hypothetical protein MFM001_11430 [Mycobacterium sp. MFM001]